MKAPYLLSAAMVLAATSFAGNVIVNNDEWTLSNFGFSTEGATNGTNFAQNAAQFLAGAPNAGTTKIWIDSDNFGLNQSSLQTALSAYNLTDSGFSAFTLSTLQNYSAVFLAGDNLTSAEITALIAYVNGGGGVYIAAGTGAIAGGAAGEAGMWNPFLNAFGLGLTAPYNGFTGNFPTASASPILNGVSQLYFDNGNSVTGPASQIIMSAQGQGVIGIASTATPEPSTILLVGIGLVAAGTSASCGLPKESKTV